MLINYAAQEWEEKERELLRRDVLKVSAADLWHLAACLILWEGGLLNFSCNLQAFSRISSLIKFPPFFPYCLHVLKEKDRCRKKREKEHIAKYLPFPEHLAKLFYVIQLE